MTWAGLAAMASFAAAGGLLGFALARRWGTWATVTLGGLLGGAALWLHLARDGAEGMRALAYGAVMAGVALPALGGAAIGGAIGSWTRGRHGA